MRVPHQEQQVSPVSADLGNNDFPVAGGRDSGHCSLLLQRTLQCSVSTRTLIETVPGDGLYYRAFVSASYVYFHRV